MPVGTLNRWGIDATAEATYGTAAVTPDKSHPFRGNRPKIVPTLVSDDDALIGVYARGKDQRATKLHSEFALEGDLRLDMLATYAKYAFGTLATTGIGPYTHTITHNAADAPSFTGYWSDAKTTATKLERYTGCKVRKLTIKGELGGKLSLAVDIVGDGTHTEQIVSMPALATEGYLIFPEISTFTIGGTDYKPRLLGFELNYENILSLDNDHGAGSTTLAELTKVETAISGSLRIKHDENGLAGLISDIEAQTSRAIILAATAGANSFTATIRRANFDDTSVDGQRGKLIKPLTFTGRYSNTDSESGRLVVINDTATYT